MSTSDKRRVLALALIILTLAGLSACDPKPQESAAPAQATATPIAAAVSTAQPEVLTVSSFDELVLAMEDSEVYEVVLDGDLVGSYGDERHVTVIPDDKLLRLNGHSVTLVVEGSNSSCLFRTGLGFVDIVGPGELRVEGGGDAMGTCLEVGGGIVELKDVKLTASKLSFGWALMHYAGNLYINGCELNVEDCLVPCALSLGKKARCILNGATFGAVVTGTEGEEWELDCYRAEFTRGYYLPAALESYVAGTAAVQPENAAKLSETYDPVSIVTRP